MDEVCECMHAILCIFLFIISIADYSFILIKLPLKKINNNMFFGGFLKGKSICLNVFSSHMILDKWSQKILLFVLYIKKCEG